MEARPGLATAIATGDAAALDQIERLCLIDRISRERAAETPGATQARAEAAMRRVFPGWE